MANTPKDHGACVIAGGRPQKVPENCYPKKMKVPSKLPWQF